MNTLLTFLAGALCGALALLGVALCGAGRVR